MTSNWQIFQLSELAEELTVGYVGPMATEYVEEGIPFLRSKNIKQFVIDYNDLKYITPEFHQRISKSSIKPGDVVIVRTGKPGTAAVIPNNLVEANCSDLVIVRPGSKLDSRFLAYYLNSIAVGHINSQLVGAVQQHFNVGSAKKLPIYAPGLATQEEIVKILGSLDDKILLNNQINQSLESIAQTIYNSWFVDFEPVKAKMEGCEPEGMDAETAALFPDSLVESELGMIPEGWEVRAIDSEVEILSGYAFKSKDYDEQGVFGLVTIKNVQDGQFVRETSNRVGSIPSNTPDYCILENGDILLSLTGNVGRICTVTGDDYLLNQRVAKLKPRYNNPGFVYTMFRNPDLKARMITIAKGTAQQNLSPIETKKLTAILPPRDLLDHTAETFDSLFNHLVALNSESVTLSDIRDTLLPKLISGEIQIPLKKADTA